MVPLEFSKDFSPCFSIEIGEVINISIKKLIDFTVEWNLNVESKIENFFEKFYTKFHHKYPYWSQ